MLYQGYKFFLLKFESFFTTAIPLKTPENASETVEIFKEWFLKLFLKVFWKIFRIARS